jgi:hypothetical protein
MFEQKNQPSQNLPTSDNVSEEEKKLFGEIEIKNNQYSSQPATMISKELVNKRKKFPLLLIVAIIILLVFGFLAIKNLSFFDQSTNENNQLGTQNNNEEMLPNENSPLVTGPQIVDTDGDGLTDEEEITLGTSINNTDSDQDGLFDYEEVKIYQTDPLNPDTDGDGYNDGTEVNSGYNPKDNAPGAKLLNILNQLEPSSEGVK